MGDRRHVEDNTGDITIKVWVETSDFDEKNDSDFFFNWLNSIKNTLSGMTCQMHERSDLLRWKWFNLLKDGGTVLIKT